MAREDGASVLDITSFAQAVGDDYVVFKQREGSEDVTSAILLVGNPTTQDQICKVKTTCNKMFIIRPAVFELKSHSEIPVKITYVPGGESAGRLREDQCFAVHCMPSTDRSKTVQQCWKESNSHSQTVKCLRAKFEMIHEDGSTGTDRELMSSGSETLSTDATSGQESDKHSESMLHCVPSKSILFEPINGPNMKRLFTTMSFINPTEVRRAVRVFCPLDPKFRGFHVETFTVDPCTQYDLTMCFLPSRSFCEQAKANKPYIAVAHIEAPDLSKTAKEVWEEYNMTPNAHCAIKRIPIEYDESALDALLNKPEIDKRYMITPSDSEVSSDGSTETFKSFKDNQSVPYFLDVNEKQNLELKEDDEKFTRKTKEELIGMDAFDRSTRESQQHFDQSVDENNNENRDREEFDPAMRMQNACK